MVVEVCEFRPSRRPGTGLRAERAIHTAAVMVDARRCLKRLPGLTNQARAARVARTLPVAPE